MNPCKINMQGTMRRYPARYRAVIAALREVRKEKGVSQRELSRRLHEVHNFVNVYEKGQRSVTVEEFVEICMALDADPHEVLERVLRRNK